MADGSWSNLSRVVYKRTYARNDFGVQENWTDTVERMIRGNIRNHAVDEREIRRLRYFITERKAMPAGRGLWFSGAPSHDLIGGAALTNCWFLCADDWMNYVLAMDLLMLGGGVGMSVESEFVRDLPKVKPGVVILHKATKDADFIVPDSREGWIELARRVFEAFFVTGQGFTWSTVCLRGAGEPIKGFGGVASGPRPLIQMVDNLCAVLLPRTGEKVRPIDAADLLCIIAECIVSGNVRRSALLILGDARDKEYLKAKRWDLTTLPSWRSNANYSVIVDDVEDLHSLFWKTYEIGEPFGIANRTAMQRFGRMGEERPDTAIGFNPCVEATLEDGEPCNLWEDALPNMDGEEEFLEGACLGLRWTKRVTCEKFHNEKNDRVVKRNRRVGLGITGCLKSPMFVPDVLDRVYAGIQAEDAAYSAHLGVPRSIRTTVVKPSGTLSKVMDMDGYEGIHPAFSRYMIQRVRFSANDPLIPRLRAAGHHTEPLIKLDKTLDFGTLVADFYVKAPDGFPVADDGWDTWKQLEVLKMAQKHWADQSVSVTVYYKKHEIPLIKEWLAKNLSEIKAVSFLCHDDHGFDQAPKEAISAETYEKAIAKLTPVDTDGVGEAELLSSLECQGGSCPVR